MVPTFHCRRAEHRSEAPPRVAPPENRYTFTYSDDEWRSQFLDRPQPAHVVNGDGYRAVVDDAGRVHALSAADRDRALRELGATYLFTTNYADVPSGWEVVPGFLAVLGDASAAQWDLQNGDRM